MSVPLKPDNRWPFPTEPLKPVKDKPIPFNPDNYEDAPL